MKIGPSADVPGAARFFQESPFRWGYFLADTVILVASVGVCVYVMIRHRNQLSPITEIVLGATVVAMLLLWKAAIQAHRRLHESFHAAGIRDLGAGSSLETATKVAASMVHLALFFTFLLVALLGMQFDRLLERR